MSDVRAMIWDVFPRKPAVFLQYEFKLRGHNVKYRQTRRIVATGSVPKDLWGVFLNVMFDHAPRRRERIAETERQIKLLALEIAAVKGAALAAADSGQASPTLPGLEHIGARVR